MLSLMALGENVSLRAAAPGQLPLLLRRVGSQLRGVFFCPQYGLCVHSAAPSKNIAFSELGILFSECTGLPAVEQRRKRAIMTLLP